MKLISFYTWRMDMSKKFFKELFDPQEIRDATEEFISAWEEGPAIRQAYAQERLGRLIGLLGPNDDIEEIETFNSKKNHDTITNK